MGFPGETAADFRELRDFVRAAEFDWMGVFTYSDVDTAGSFALGKFVDEETKIERRDELMALQKKNFRAKIEKRIVGRSEIALLEGVVKPKVKCCGRRGWKAWHRTSTEKVFVK